MPQCATDSPVAARGERLRVWPVQARSALRWEMIQSVVPSRCRLWKVVFADLVAIRAVIGDVEVMRW